MCVPTRDGCVDITAYIAICLVHKRNVEHYTPIGLLLLTKNALHSASGSIVVSVSTKQNACINLQV